MGDDGREIQRDQADEREIVGEGGREIKQEQASGGGWERDIARANKWGRVGER